MDSQSFHGSLVVAVRELSCSMACGILLSQQGLNLHLLDCGQILSYWTTREVLSSLDLVVKNYCGKRCIQFAILSILRSIDPWH